MSDPVIDPQDESVLSTTTSEDTLTPSTKDDTSLSEIEILQQEISKLRDQLARSQADYNNLLRRNREEITQLTERSENKLLLKFLTILDNLERALWHTPEEFSTHTWTEWIHSIVRWWGKILEDAWVSVMECMGEEIDPNRHEVISSQPWKDNTVLTVVAKWYMKNGLVLRPAVVISGNGSDVLS